MNVLQEILKHLREGTKPVEGDELHQAAKAADEKLAAPAAEVPAPEQEGGAA